MKFTVLISVTLTTCMIAIACSKSSSNDSNSPTPQSKNPTGNSAPASLQDQLTASRSEDKTTRLNAIKSLETTLKTASMEDSLTIASRLMEMVQQDPDQDVKNEATRVLNTGGGDKSQNQGKGSNSSENNNNGSTATGEFAGYARCLKKVEHASDAANILISTPICSPLLKGAQSRDVSTKLTEWTQTNCQTIIPIDNARFPYENSRARADSPWFHYGNNVNAISEELAAGTKCTAKRAQIVTYGNLESTAP